MAPASWTGEGPQGLVGGRAEGGRPTARGRGPFPGPLTIDSLMYLLLITK